MKKNQIHIKYGITTSVILIVLTIIFFATKINLASSVQMGLLCGIIITGVMASCRSFKKLQVSTRNEIFFNGFRTTAIIALLVIGFGVLALTAFPSIKKQQVTQYTNQATKSMQDALATEKAIAIDSVKSDPVKVQALEIVFEAKKINELSRINADVLTYKKRFTTWFIGINMMIVVISGLIGSAIGAFANKIN
jgi:hypothetical protein